MKAFARALLVLIAVALIGPAQQAAARVASKGSAQANAATATALERTLSFGDARLHLRFNPQNYKITGEEIDDWVLRSARAVASFFGTFPASEVDITISPGRGDEVMEGEANADPKARIRIVLGRETTIETLKSDSTMVHEMTHLGFPDLDDRYLWLHEGLATYVEHVARAQVREIAPAQMWGRFTEIMAQGLPGEDDKGLDDTPNEDRRYYGGAMFWLVADIEIRKRTGNRFGVQHAIRAIHAAGGSLAVDSTPQDVLAIGDRAVGVPVLTGLFVEWRAQPVTPDLDELWAQLGVRSNGEKVTLVADAPLVALRRAITQPPSRPILLVGPSLLYEATLGR